MMFQDRQAAGIALAHALKEYADRKDTVVIGLPRGGVVVAYEVASALHLPLDIVCPRKIGAPFNPEYAIGAVTETGEATFSEVVEELGISESELQQAVKREKQQAAWRLEHYRKGRPPRHIVGKAVIVIDDGLATGSTMEAAIKTLRAEQAKSIVMAVPVAPADTLLRLKQKVDATICLATPTPFYAVGQFYTHFDQTTDSEVIALLSQSLLVAN